jgi:hypothetical protein
MLPTEPQWEYACRAGATSRFYNGDDDADAEKIAWYKANAGAGTKPVGQLAANAWGIYDMSGNVYEWCRDTYGPYNPGGPVVGAMDKQRTVLRGGSWFRPIADVRSAARYRNTPASRNADNGFRIIATIAALPPVERGANDPPPPVDPRPVPPPQEGEGHGWPTATPPPAAPNVEYGSQPSQPITHGVQASGPGVLAFLPCAIVLVVVAVLVMVIVKFVRASQRPYGQSFATSAPPPLPSSGPFRIGDDGFWLDTSGFMSGQIIQYVYDTPQGRVTQQVAVEPSPRGQFIYTGVRPMNLMLAGGLGGGNAYNTGLAAGALQQMMMQQEAERQREEERRRRNRRSSYRSDDYDSDASSSDFPSAY